ncbi:MAG: hypothetical protein IJY44_05240 [Bacteroidaceae bacterium]|nr:hypothetical protein [Bacteroidaceae bacterium]
MRNKEEIRLQRVVALFCTALFALFAFFFTARYQASLLELLYDRIATGKLEFNRYVVATIITAVLVMLALWLNKFSKFKREWTALSFLPSFLILSFITDIDRSLYTGGYSYVKWIVAFAVAAVMYFLFSFVMSRMLFAKIKNVAMSANRILWRNLVLLVLMFLLAGTLSNGEEGFKREALMYSLQKRGETEKALEIGRLSNVASKTLTAQRASLLAACGKLGERLFEYPQYYGAAGIMPAEKQISPLAPESVYSLLCAVPLPGENALEFFKRAAEASDAPQEAKEYYLSALLLERRLSDFVECVAMSYPDVPLQELPKHYREALYLYYNINGDSVEEYAGSDIAEEYAAFKELEAEHADPFVRSNYLRRRFGRTYWWYFVYGI